VILVDPFRRALVEMLPDPGAVGDVEGERAPSAKSGATASARGHHLLLGPRITERNCREWIDQNHFVCRERSLSNDGTRLITREVVVHDERGVIADQFYAERLYTVDRIQSLLNGAGFKALRHHRVLEAESDRAQDLGMMARRLFLTATGPRHETRAPKGAQVLDVAVVMGDPRMPDTVKREGKFNAEDFDTITRLKDALSELKGYRFRYLDNHATMERDLATSARISFQSLRRGLSTTTPSWSCMSPRSWR